MHDVEVPRSMLDLFRASRLDEYYDWPALRRTRRARKTLRMLGGLGDAALVPLVMVSPSIGLTMWTAGRGMSALVRRALGHTQRVEARMLRDWQHVGLSKSADLMRLAEGTPVRLRGRVRVRRPVTSLLSPCRPAAYSRLILREEMIPERAFFVERGRDFDLEDDHVAVRICTRHARLAKHTHTALHPISSVETARLARALPAHLLAKRPLAEQQVRAAEIVLAEHAEIELVGFCTRVVDPTAPALPRHTPRRPAVTGRHGCPLLMVPRSP